MVYWLSIPAIKEMSLFNNTFNTLFIYGYMAYKHMVKDYSDSEKKTYCHYFPISSKFFYMHHPTDRIAYTVIFVIPVVEHWLEREIAQWTCN